MTRTHRLCHRFFAAVALAFLLPAGASAATAATAATSTPVTPDSVATSPVRSDGLYVTIFRNPASGLELRRGNFGAFAGYYPTILKADGQDEGENTNFIRIGISAYRKPRGWSHYAATSLVISLDDDWKNGILTDVGMRAPIGGWLHARLGVGLLTTFDGEVRVNPTVGFDVFPAAW